MTTITFDRAVEFAARAHAGKRDQSGMAYLRHVLRVAHAVERDGGTEDEMIVAVLHDVVEDTRYTLDDLRDLGLTEAQLDAVDCLTKRPGESYEDRITRALRNPIARRVKRWDIGDNLDLTRIKNADNLGPADLERIANYIKAIRRLGA